MATVPRALLDRYVALINGVTANTLALTNTQLAVAGFDPATVKTIVKQMLKTASSAVSEVDKQFYEKVRQINLGRAGSFDIVTRQLWDDDYIDRVIDSYYDDNGSPYDIGFDAESFADALSLFISRKINEASKTYMNDYGDRDYVEPKYARVPSGAETCAWCWALAGLGFHYKSAETASHSHDNCDCVVTPSWGAGVEGYDPGYYANAFNSAKYDMENGHISDALRQRINERADTVDGYTKNWNGVLATMREKYGLK